jgi:FAD/FMN-containing dehydrogenase
MLDLAPRIETPKSAAEVVELVANAREEGRPLEIVGGGTKRGIGAVRGAEAVLSLAGLNKVIDYAPEELVLTAQAGVTLAALEKLVAAEGQMLPFEPPHLVKLLGAPAHPGRRGARPLPGLRGGHRAGRADEGRRAGGQERHRLRPAQADGGLVGDAGGADGGDDQGAPGGAHGTQPAVLRPR